jgi:hypothetical protein
MRDAVVASIAKIIEERYVDPVAAEQLAAQFLDRRHTYNQTDPVRFADAMSLDLFMLSDDRHLQISFAPDEVITDDIASDGKGAESELSGSANFARQFDNYGIARVEVLSGNVGYLKLNHFLYEPAALERLDAAFKFLSSVDALVLDLQDNRGGNTEFVRYLQGYFFDSPRLAMRYQDRGNVDLIDAYTLPPSGKTRADLPLFVLVNSQTASAAEDVAYSAQAFSYGTVVGETTAGAAHTVQRVPIASGFIVTVSTGTPVHPITQSNWNRTGVAPDLKADSQTALTMAHHAALKGLIAESQLAHLNWQYEWALAPLNAELFPVDLSQNQLMRFAGYYGAGRITYSQGALHYASSKKGQPKQLTAVSENLFQIEGLSNVRLRFELLDHRVYLERLFADGRVDRFQRIHR